MLKIFRHPQNNHVYIGTKTFPQHEDFIVEQSLDSVSVKIYNTNFYEIKDMPFSEICTISGSQFTTTQECYDYLVETLNGKDLRLYKFIPNNSDPKTSDFTIIGLEKESPSYDRGRKSRSKYLDPNDSEIVVEKIFEDVRDTNGNLKELRIVFNWYDETGAISETKTETVKKYNKAEAKTEERKRRERQIDFLLSEGEGTPIEPIMDAIFMRYHNEQLLYKETGSSALTNAINNEQDQQYLDYFQIRVPVATAPEYTVPIKEAILYQIGGIDGNAFNAALAPA